MFARLLILFCAIVSYGVFFVSTLYAIGFVGNFAVPKSIDTGQPASPVEAVGIYVPGELPDPELELLVVLE